MVYFLVRPSDGRIKIGTSETLSNRIVALNVEHGPGLHLLGVMPGDHVVEREVHRQFAPSRFQGEWFDDTPGLREFIAANATEWDGEDPHSLKSILSLKGTPKLEAWIDKLTTHSESGSRANMFRRAMKAFAKAQNFEDPMPEL